MQRRGAIRLTLALGLMAGLVAGCGGGEATQQKPGGMPPDVAAEMQKRMGTTTGPGVASPGGTSTPQAGK